MKTLSFLILITLSLSLGSACGDGRAASTVPTPSTSTTATQAIPTMKASETLSPPKITLVSGPTQIVGPNLWLFAIDDGGQSIAVSGERNGDLIVGRLNLSAPSSPVEWKIVASPADTGGERVADHWHVFAHDYHWIVFSTTGAKGSYLLKLDHGFNRISLTRVASNVAVTGEGRPTAPGPSNTRQTQNLTIPTNDMFLAPEADGVAVGHFLPGYGHRIFRLGLDGQLRSTVDVGGGQFGHANGSSAERNSVGFTILATENLMPLFESAIKRIETDINWKPLTVSSLIAEERSNVAMASSVLLANGYRIVNARVISQVNPRPQMGQPPKQGGPESPPAQPGQLPSDDGAIVRYVISPDGKVASREALVDKKEANRPHTALIGDLLVTTWDQNGAVWLRLDRVSQ